MEFAAQAALARQQLAIDEALHNEERLKLEAEERERVAQEEEQRRKREQSMAALNAARYIISFDASLVLWNQSP